MTIAKERKGKRGKSLITLKPGFLLSDVTLVMDLVHDVEGDQLRVEVGVITAGHGRIRINQLPVFIIQATGGSMGSRFVLKILFSEKSQNC